MAEPLVPETIKELPVAETEKVEMLRKNVTDFVDLDTELENKLQAKLAVALNKALAALRKELKKILESPEGHDYNSKKSKTLIEMAITKFNEEWMTQANKILGPEIEASVSRGILQSKDMIAVVEGDKSQLRKYMKSEAK